MAVAASAPGRMWFVKTGGQVWGPYPHARVDAFVREGRVQPTTLLSPFAEGPWQAAAELEGFAASPLPPGPATSASTTTPATPPTIVTPAPAPPSNPPPGRTLDFDAAERGPAPPAAPGPERALLVFAEVTSMSPAAFQAALERLGGRLQVRSGLWLLRAPMPAAALRNMLSRRLGSGDSLLVVEAPMDQAAWFNLAPASDRELRRLWSGA